MTKALHQAASPGREGGEKLQEGWISAQLGYRGTESLAYRATRYATLVLALLTGWLEPALWIFVVLTAAAAAVRAWNVAAQERRSPSPRGTSA